MMLSTHRVTAPAAQPELRARSRVRATIRLRSQRYSEFALSRRGCQLFDDRSRFVGLLGFCRRSLRHHHPRRVEQVELLFGWRRFALSADSFPVLVAQIVPAETSTRGLRVSLGVEDFVSDLG